MPTPEEKTPAPAATTAAGRYEQLSIEREPFLRRAEEAARLTIPRLFPPNGTKDGADLPDPYQSMGALGLNNLTSKLLLALFPPGSAFFRLTVDDYVAEELAERIGAEDPRAALETALGTAERAVMTRFDQNALRVQLEETLRFLALAGTHLLYITPKGRARSYDLRQFVVRRDEDGVPLDIIVKRELHPSALPDAAYAIWNARQESGDDTDPNNVRPAALYTRIVRKGKRYRVYQEIVDTEIPGTSGWYPADKLPWIVPALNRLSGENYGRGIISDYIGDLATLERLCGALVDLAAACSKILFFGDEGGTTSLSRVAKAPSGAMLPGRASDISVLMVEKMHDFTVVKNVKDDLEKRLGECLLVASSARRDAERVTAEEIRLLAGELEQGLGGIYTSLTDQLQLPLVKVHIAQMQKSGSLPPLPKEVVNPSIVTGMAALGRNADLERLERLTAGVAERYGPDAVKEYINVGNDISRRASALGIDAKGLIRTEDEVNARRQQAAAQAITERSMPAAINAEAKMATAPTTPAGGVQ